MAVRIRLVRRGTRGKPFFRFAVMDGRNARDGRAIEFVGTYDPKLTKDAVKLDVERVTLWLGRGAKATDTVQSILRRQGLLKTSAAPAVPASGS